jgi:ubiquinone/menaquinone biosynthesis C-methylase UbiE
MAFQANRSRKSAIPLCGKADSVFICVNSLTKANLITGADFAPAVLRQGEIAETRSNPPGTMVNFFFKDANVDIAAVYALTVLENVTMMEHGLQEIYRQKRGRILSNNLRY